MNHREPTRPICAYPEQSRGNFPFTGGHWFGGCNQCDRGAPKWIARRRDRGNNKWKNDDLDGFALPKWKIVKREDTILRKNGFFTVGLHEEKIAGFQEGSKRANSDSRSKVTQRLMVSERCDHFVSGGIPPISSTTSCDVRRTFSLGVRRQPLRGNGAAIKSDLPGGGGDVAYASILRNGVMGIVKIIDGEQGAIRPDERSRVSKVPTASIVPQNDLLLP